MLKKKPISIYIHIPFCKQKCKYCDFLSFPENGKEQEHITAYVDALCEEIRLYSVVQEQYYVDTVYIGGGTPSYLDVSLIRKIMKCLRTCFTVSNTVEITIECNPGTLDVEKLMEYKMLGINRLSIGLQTSHDELLLRLGRIHTFEQFVEQYYEARKQGFSNISIDIMSALPGETFSMYQKDVEEVIRLAPEHISSYGLIVEDGTPLSCDKKLLSMLPEEDVAVAMYEYTGERLQKAGYERYEISNYSKPGRQSRHNSAYWIRTAYIGFGLGASSYLAEWKDCEGHITHIRYHNTTDFSEYVKLLSTMESKEKSGLQSGFLLWKRQWKEPIVLSSKDRIEEFMFLGMRRMEGVSCQEFFRQFQKNLYDVYGSVIEKYQKQGLIQILSTDNDDRIALTEEGILVSNSIFSDFLLDET